MPFKFEKLTVWQRALELSTYIHHAIARTFPKDELYGLTSQLQRAADSISLNIAEGSTGQTNAELKQFLGYALRSAIEVVGCLYLAKRRRLIREPQFQELYAETETIVRMLQAFRKRVS